MVALWAAIGPSQFASRVIERAFGNAFLPIYAQFMGRPAFPSLVVQALAQSLGAWPLTSDGDRMLAILVFVVAVNVLATIALWRLAIRSARPNAT